MSLYKLVKWWGGRGSNPRPEDYEVSDRAQICPAPTTGQAKTAATTTTHDAQKRTTRETVRTIIRTTQYRAPMARIKQMHLKGDKSSWKVEWLLAGRGSSSQSYTFPHRHQALRANDLIRDRKACGLTVTAEAIATIVLALPAREPVRQCPTVREWASIWLTSKINISDHTRGVYRGQLDRHLLPILGHLHLDEVTGTHIASVIERLQDRGLTAVTIDRYHAVMSGMFGFAVAERHIPDSPVRRITWTRDTPAHDDAGDDGDTRVYLAPPQVQRLIDCADDDAKPIIWSLYNTGARWSELTAVAVRSVDLLGQPPKSRPTIRIHRAWKLGGRNPDGTRQPRYLGATKGRGRRTVSMPVGVTVDWWAPLVAGRDGDELLIHAPGDVSREMPYDWFVDNRWDVAVSRANKCPRHPPVRDDGTQDRRKRAVSTCGCPGVLGCWPTLHSLRHSHVSALIAAGVPLLAISRRIGHKSISVTETVYAHILPDLEDDVADLLGGHEFRSGRLGVGGLDQGEVLSR